MENTLRDNLRDIMIKYHDRMVDEANDPSSKNQRLVTEDIQNEILDEFFETQNA